VYHGHLLHDHRIEARPYLSRNANAAISVMESRDNDMPIGMGMGAGIDSSSGPARIRVTKRARPARPGTPCPADGRAAAVVEVPASLGRCIVRYNRRTCPRLASTTNPSRSAATGRSA
jgi:hypothetical protein